MVILYNYIAGKLKNFFFEEGSKDLFRLQRQRPKKNVANFEILIKKTNQTYIVYWTLLCAPPYSYWLCLLLGIFFY